MKQLLISVLILSSTLFCCETYSSQDELKSHVTDDSEAKLPELIKSSFTYKTIEKDTLSLDYYTSRAIEEDSIYSPLVLFVHGGGFYTGVRDEENIICFCSKLSNKGFKVAAISYRLFLKGQSFHCDQAIPNKIKAFQYAVNDLRSATRYFIDHSDSLRIDTSKIIIIGSSSGAETILQAAYWPNELMNLDEQELSNDFKYAGMVSLAGAMTDTSLVTSESAIPGLFFHGTCDPLVPFASATHHYCPEKTPGALMLHGSKSISEKLHSLGKSYQLIAECGGKHGMASRPMDQYFDRIVEFLNACVLKGEWWQSQMIVQGEENCTFPHSDFCK